MLSVVAPYLKRFSSYLCSIALKSKNTFCVFKLFEVFQEVRDDLLVLVSDFPEILNVLDIFDDPGGRSSPAKVLEVDMDQFQQRRQVILSII